MKDRLSLRPDIGNRGEAILGGIAVVVVMGFYLSLWWNRSIGLATEGWFQVFAESWSQGKLPYKDFYLFVTPGHLLETSFLRSLGFSGYLDFRLAGALQRVALVLVLYAWLLRFATARCAFVAALTAGLVYSGDGADVLFYINHSSLLYSLAAGWLLSCWLEKPKPLFLFASGLLAAAAFWCKQTLGLGIGCFLAAVLLVSVLAKKNGRRPVSLLFFAAGALLPTIPILVWMLRSGIWPAFLEQVFGAGSSSKGSLQDIFYRPFSVALIPVGIAGLAYLWGRGCGFLPLEKPQDKVQVPGQLLKTAAVALGGLGLGLLLALAWPARTDPIALKPVQLVFVFLGISSCWWIVARSFYRARHRLADVFVCQEFLVGGTGVVVWLFFALSNPLFELMAVPSVGVALVLAIQWLANKPAFSSNPGSGYRLQLAWALLIAVMVASKLLTPFSFFGITETSAVAPRGETASPMLRGMNLSAETNAGLERALSYLDPYTGTTGNVFVFPHVPMLYSLSGAYPETFALLHWIDVTPDYITEADIRRLQENEPRVIIRMPLEEGEIIFLEEQYRGGRESRFRQMAHALDGMLRGYERKESILIGPRSRILEVWLKKEEPQP